jgi:aryl-alcohol dehydrogenase-like predicted oxidoreductase
LQRTVERELLPMAKAFNMTLTPWAPIAGGALSGKYKSDENAGRLKPGSARLNDRAQMVTDKVIEIANQIGATPAQVAINWTRQIDQKVVPIIGARKVEQILDSIGATTFVLSEQQMKELNEVSAIEMGFPHDFLAGEGVKNYVYGGLKDQLKF